MLSAHAHAFRIHCREEDVWPSCLLSHSAGKLLRLQKGCLRSHLISGTSPLFLCLCMNFSGRASVLANLYNTGVLHGNLGLDSLHGRPQMHTYIIAIVRICFPFLPCLLQNIVIPFSIFLYFFLNHSRC